MKKTLHITAILALFTLSHPSLADLNIKRPYANIQVQAFNEQTQKWEHFEQLPPLEYPANLYSKFAGGCTIASFNIDQGGLARDIDVTTARPNLWSQRLVKGTKQIIRDWDWPTHEENASIAMTLRFDYCVDTVTREEIAKQCFVQSLEQCESDR